MDNYIGRMLDNRYEILEVIGIGGMAVVYKARCHRLNRLVAIKILKDEFSRDAEFRRRFHAESQAVAMLSHPNIVSVYDVSHSGDTDYIVMELIDGITLKQYMGQKGQLNWREALHFSTQIAKALEHAHSRGIIHRDIKPHNIMILKDGSIKVADFGIARITSAQSTLTREALGSVHYISPEQARGSRVDKRTDLYSLGVVMYEMLTGKPPFDGESPVAVAIQHINGTPILPTEVNAGIPKGLEQITMHAMVASLNQRYESATDMLYDLDEFRKNPNVVFDFSTAATTSQATLPIGSLNDLQGSQAARAERAVHGGEKKSESNVTKKERGTSNRIAVAAGVIGIILAVLGIFAFLYSTFLRDLFAETEEIPVPNFVGMYFSEIDLSAYPDFEIIGETYVNDENVPEGQVISQTPKKDSVVKVGSKIRLTVSLGPVTSEVRMPGVIGQSLENATNLLRGMGYQVQPSRVSDDTVEKDTVISTDPVEGTVLNPGMTIILTVSDGPEEELVKVPALKGMDVTQALEALTSEGLERGLVNYVPDDTAKDTVIYQSIEQDKMVPKGTVINLQVSKGPEEEAPPVEEDPEMPPEDDEPMPPTPNELVIVIPLVGEGEAQMTMSLDGVVYGDPILVDRSQGSIEVTVAGTGLQTLNVYLDGIMEWTETIDFGE